MYYHEPNGTLPFIFENISLVPHVKSNILSEYLLKKGGCEISGSRTGEYRFALYESDPRLHKQPGAQIYYGKEYSV